MVSQHDPAKKPKIFAPGTFLIGSDSLDPNFTGINDVPLLAVVATEKVDLPASLCQQPHPIDDRGILIRVVVKNRRKRLVVGRHIHPGLR